MREPFQYEQPLCAEVDSELFFPEKESGKTTAQQAKSICSKCIHKSECLEWAIVNVEQGVWGGTTERQRLKMRRKRGLKLRA